MSRDFRSHLAELEAQGLLIRIDRPINKDTKLYPLVRCQFIGGIAENDRRASLFTNVVDSAGHRYDMPVAMLVRSNMASAASQYHRYCC